MSYNLFTQVIPPTGVELCLTANFTGEADVNLLVAKGNVLDIYALHRHNPEAAADAQVNRSVFLRSAVPFHTHVVQAPRDVASFAGSNHSLRLVASHSLFGNIVAMSAVRFPGAHKDALILSFRDAKARFF